MERRYRQMLMDERAHAEISEAKELMYRMSGRRLNSREIIDEFLGRRLRLLRLKKEIRAYIDAFVSKAALNENVLGIMLFGSVAKSIHGKYSDIDLLIVVNGKALSLFNEMHRIIESLEWMRGPLLKNGSCLRISQMLLSVDELTHFRPIYVDFLEDGIILFERNEVLTAFLNDIRRSVDYEKVIVNGAVMTKWRIRK